MNKEIIYFMNKTPLHVGTGEPSPLDDSIKGAIQRHPITNTPIVPGSSLKGALRSHFALFGVSNNANIDINTIFGKEADNSGGSAGQYIFSDLNIIAQPVTAIDGATFKTVYLMKKHYLQTNICTEKTLTICDVDITGKMVKLNENNFTNQELYNRLNKNPYNIDFCFFVDDITFNLLCNNLVWVRSRNSLLSHKELSKENGKSEFQQRIEKQVAGGALWKEEYVIDGAVWEGFIINRIDDKNFFSILGDKSEYEFFLGGLETIGCGLMEVL